MRSHTKVINMSTTKKTYFDYSTCGMHEPSSPASARRNILSLPRLTWQGGGHARRAPRPQPCGNHLLRPSSRSYTHLASSPTSCVPHFLLLAYRQCSHLNALGVAQAPSSLSQHRPHPYPSTILHRIESTPCSNTRDFPPRTSHRVNLQLSGTTSEAPNAGFKHLVILSPRLTFQGPHAYAHSLVKIVQEQPFHQATATTAILILSSHIPLLLDFPNSASHLWTLLARHGIVTTLTRYP